MRWPILFVTVSILSGCLHGGYSGDGQFTDNGWEVYSRRYVIDLGPIDLSTPGTYSFRLSGLPHAEFVVGIRVFEEKKNEWNAPRPSYPVSVRMQLRTAEGETVIFEEGSLNSWTRSYGVLDNISDLSRQGEGRAIPLPGGGTRGERVGFKASGGWGTHFDSEVDKTYLLKLEVLSSHPSMNRPARLSVLGWDR
jgi:hypothetical protein